MRLFAAIFPPRELAAATRGLVPPRPLDRAYRAVRPEQRHLTLCFLGEVADPEVPAVEAAFRGLEARTGVALAPVLPARFTARLTHLGVFPHLDRPRVLWAGVEPAGPLADLHRAVAAAAGPWQEAPAGRSFVPHLTLGRWKRPPYGRNLLPWLEKTRLPKVEWPVAEVVLVASTRDHRGAEYSVRERVVLAPG